MSAIQASPHAHGARTVGEVMAIVMLALCPATLLGFWQFGWPSIILFAITLASAVLTEAVCARLAGRRTAPMLLDGSAVLTGWLLALSLPPWAPWWIAVVGSAFAIAIGKQAFGGIGQNVFNPAMVGRVMLLISFPLEMTQWVAPHPLFASGSPGPAESLALIFSGSGVPDAMASASLLGHVKTEASRGVDLLRSMNAFAPFDAALGIRSGSLGETGAVPILAGGIFLIAQRIIGLRIPLGFLLGVALPALVANLLAPQHFLPVAAHLLSGGVMLGAFFIATDYVTSPSTPRGQWIFAIGCGLITWIVRTWGAYPEGVAFAVLLMNAVTPLIDRWTRPRIFGRTRDGRSLEPARNPAPKEAAR